MRYRNIAELSGSDNEMLRNMGDGLNSNLRVACPGIIQSFNSEEQTVTVQLSLREQVSKYDSSKQQMEIPLLLDVPIVIPRAGGYCLTMPIKKGDECLVVFGDMCIDGWWSLGGVQNQIEKRRHDLSDGFAILGTWSQPRKIKNYSLDSCEIRNEEATCSIELKNNTININADSVNINGINFDSHTHSCPHGGSTSGPS